MKSKKGFTLVELVAVLVIMAIIATIATPLVLTLVNSAKESANKRSVDAYGKSVEIAILSYLMDNNYYPSELKDLQVQYTGSEVICNVMQLNEDGSLYLSECSVAGKEVKDKNTEDGYYHFGKLGIPYVEENLTLDTPTISIHGDGASADGGAGVALKINSVAGITGIEVYTSDSEAGEYTLLTTVLASEINENGVMNVAADSAGLYYKVRTYVDASSGKIYSDYSNIVTPQ